MKTTLNFKIFGLVMILLLYISCSSNHKGGQPEMNKQITEFTVMTVKLQSTKLFKDYPATLKGQQTVEIRSKITGYIEKILVDEGAYVKKGQLLFRLNDNDLLATMRSADAQVKVVEADLNTAKINLEKTKPLVDKNIISTFDLKSVESELTAKEAQLSQAKANLENAMANLQYTLITSPAEGSIGTFPFRVGSLVSSTTTDALTTVSNTEKMYAYFSLNEKEFLTLIKGLKGKNLQEKLAMLPEVSLVLADNSVYEQNGRIETASGLVDQQSGSVMMRATFSNPEGLLRNGGSGSVCIPQYVNSAIIIPQKATFELQGKYFVYVVGSDNIVHNTEIEVLVGNLKESYVVTSGLKEGDRIVLEGSASLHNDSKIKPKLVDAGSLSENASSANQVHN